MYCGPPIPNTLACCGTPITRLPPQTKILSLRFIRHTHLKDSVGSGEDRKYVLTGRGNVPIQRQIEALRSIRYKGFYCFEWEKLWHPDIDDPEIAIADYARVVAECLGNARGCGL